MSVSVEVRRKSFWVADFLRGSQISGAVGEISASLEDPRSRSFQELHTRRLVSILAHAANTTPAFRGCSPRDLSSFPVTDKNMIREHPTEYLSFKYHGAKLRRRVTSGSTGTPFVSYQDPAKVARNIADTISFTRRIGYDVGAPVYYFTVWPATSRATAAKQRLQNVTPVDVTRLDGPLVANIAAKLSRRTVGANLIGYASAIEQFCVLLDQLNISLPPGAVESVLATSEAPSLDLPDLTRTILGRPLNTRYSNIENGILGQRHSESDFYHMNTASYHFELLDLHSDSRAEDGAPGRIVITDLFNRAMPFIRYDTGDVGVWHTDPDGSKDINRFGRVEGRRSDIIYDSRDRPLSTHFVAKVMNKYVDVRQYQVIQTGQGTYTIRINAPNDELRNGRIAADFKRDLGGDARLTIEHTPGIPLLASGKRRRIISEWSPEIEK